MTSSLSTAQSSSPQWSYVRLLFRDKTALFGILAIAVFLITALGAPWLSPYDPRTQNILRKLEAPSAEHWLGTDEFGRDVLSRIIWGTRPSLLVGVLSVLLAMMVGGILGITAGYIGGVYDLVITQIVDGFMAFPTLLLSMLVVAVLGTGVENTIIAIAVSFVPQFARLARGPAIALKEANYIEACRAMGVPDFLILSRHIVPNISGPIIVMATLWIGTAIRTEANLSFLGMGIQPPMPSWGTMIKAGVERITRAPWLAVYPSLAIMLSVFAFNLVGDGIRDTIDPEMRGRKEKGESS